MSQILTLKIDVTKFYREAFYKGEKGTYATISVFVNDEKDDYGNFGMIRQDIGKERREAGEKGPILGNVVRIFNQDSKPRQPQAPAMNEQARQAQRSHQAKPQERAYDDRADEIPF
jgi:hypothetical protein